MTVSDSRVQVVRRQEAKRGAILRSTLPAQCTRGVTSVGRTLTKKECQGIQRAFCDDPTNAYCKIRNQIAHGDPNLKISDVQVHYAGLHGHVKQAIIELLALSAGTVDDTKNYYDEISRLVDGRFHGLPPT